MRFEGRSLTYGELDAAADRVARTLRDLGAGPGTVVAVCAERSLELLPGLLGVLKAGGRVPADRPRVSAGAGGVHAGGRRTGRAAHPAEHPP
ncbi:AMP-binding protein [Nonomuraea salmonea]|uniref:AMP-binding protein n=1 Tax=Nonomuraea salmonea TaxID=46181 RepID=UPI0031EEC319